ncbi:MAG: hypothetical protein V4538_15710 [Bacteroidota bacterium]
MKTYTFILSENDNIKISIKAIDENEANALLDIVVKYSKEWELKSII